jgi:hypothetical protein
MALSSVGADVWLTSPRKRGEGEVVPPLQPKLVTRQRIVSPLPKALSKEFVGWVERSETHRARGDW